MIEILGERISENRFKKKYFCFIPTLQAKSHAPSQYFLTVTAKHYLLTKSKLLKLQIPVLYIWDTYTYIVNQ